jgi:hypothetical protein
MRSLLLSFILIVYSFSSMAQNESDNAKLAEKYFTEIKAIAAKEHGKLWGINLYGPILLVDGGTQTIYANEGDSGNLLKKQDNIYTGSVPKGMQLANTAIEWSGKKWTMILWPLTTDSLRRHRLVFHELFHRIQNRIGLPDKNAICNHLDTKEGRIYLRLEFEALKAAVSKPVSQRKEDLLYALLYRKYRQDHFPGAKTLEDMLELNEGLAEFTGVTVSKINPPNNKYLIRLLDSAHVFHSTFVRSLGYVTGPAYGTILSAKSARWNRKIKAGDDFESLVIKYYGIKIPGNWKILVTAGSTLYERADIEKEETTRDEIKSAQVKMYKEKLVDGPVLLLPLTDKKNYTFNPNNLVSFKENETVYPDMTVQDEWGEISVSDGALLQNWKLLSVSLYDLKDPRGQTITTAGWTLELRDGWTVAPGPRPGDYQIVEKKK